MIETDAALQPGDSGGPLFASGTKVVGMNTAAATGYGYRFDAATDGYAIPIDRALTIVHAIRSGKASSTVHVGATAFIGIAVQPTSANPFAFGGVGDVIVAVTPGSPAVTAGLAPGDVITAVAGRQVTSTSRIASLLLRKTPGDKVTVTYFDRTGTSRRRRSRWRAAPRSSRNILSSRGRAHVRPRPPSEAASGTPRKRVSSGP